MFESIRLFKNWVLLRKWLLSELWFGHTFVWHWNIADMFASCKSYRVWWAEGIHGVSRDRYHVIMFVLLCFRTCIHVKHRPVRRWGAKKAAAPPKKIQIPIFYCNLARKSPLGFKFVIYFFHARTLQKIINFRRRCRLRAKNVRFLRC